ncbi:oligosaccharide flippase family protein [Naasia sp. SYSU D00057]|uniref:oligosaccharide flippase family protein n=1 Tax=Naasia sp. SYSU D00057 TaxID=2817380 RepID=UPI001B30DF84|nr:oligosaccharide flippase family protein [Naasia sp. SYSU D00057]
MTTTTPSLGDSAARGTGVTLLGQAVRVVLQFASTVILARLLAPEDFGLVAMVAAVIGISELIRDFGLSSAAIQAKNVTDDERTNLFWVNTGLGVATALLMVLLSPLIVLLYGEPRLFWIVAAMSTTFVFSGINTQFKADLTRSLRFALLTGIEVAGVVAGFVLGIVGAVLGLEYWAIVLQQVATVAVATVLNVAASRWKPGLPKRHVSIRRFVRFGLGVLGTQGISYVTKNVDSVAIGAVWGASPLGLYDRAYQLLMTPLNQINAPMTRVALPILSRVHEDKDVFSRYLRKSQLVGAYLTATVFAVATGLATPLVLVLFGERWIGVAAIFAALAVGGMFRAIAQISYWMYLATGRTGAQLRMFLAVRPIMIVIILAGLPWGPVGVAIGQTVAYALHWVVSLWRVGVVTGVDTKPLFANALRTVFTISVPCGVLAWLGTLLPAPPIVQLLAGVGFALAYVALAALVIPFVRDDVTVVLSFARRMFARRAGRKGIAWEREQKRIFARLLQDAAPHLRAGRWSLPTVSSAFHAGPEGRRAERRAQASRRPPRDVKERLVRRRTAIAAPRSVAVTTGSGGAVEALLTKERGLVLFDRDGGAVTHVRRAPFPEGYEENRAALSRVLPNPSWSLSGDRTVLREGLAAGTEFSRAPLDARLAAVRGITAAYTELTRDTASGSSGAAMEGALARALAPTDGASSSIRAEVEALAPALREAAAAWPLALSHGDLTGLNLLVTPDGAWSAIDFEDAGPRPYFYDPYVLLLRDAELLAALRDGRLDADFGALHAAAGLPGPADHELLLRAGALLAAEYHERMHGGRFWFSLKRAWPTGA